MFKGKHPSKEAFRKPFAPVLCLPIRKIDPEQAKSTSEIDPLVSLPDR